MLDVNLSRARLVIRRPSRSSTTTPCSSPAPAASRAARADAVDGRRGTAALPTGSRGPGPDGARLPRRVAASRRVGGRRRQRRARGARALRRRVPRAQHRQQARRGARVHDLMAPEQRSEGALSRLTCKACHFEGIVDGRTHDTGRTSSTGKHVRATTRPLWGLFNNKPLFSARSTRTSRAWRTRIPRRQRQQPPRALVRPHAARRPVGSAPRPRRHAARPRAAQGTRRVPARLQPRTNPHVLQSNVDASTRRFTDLQRRGAEAFRERCASVTRPASWATTQPASGPSTLGKRCAARQRPPVWSSASAEGPGIDATSTERARGSTSLATGVAEDAAVHERRRRLARGRTRHGPVDGETFLHASERPLPGLGDDEKRALLAFLLLLWPARGRPHAVPILEEAGAPWQGLSAWPRAPPRSASRSPRGSAAPAARARRWPRVRCPSSPSSGQGVVGLDLAELVELALQVVAGGVSAISSRPRPRPRRG